MSKTKSQLVAEEISALERARTPLIVVRTFEEARAEEYLASAAASAAFVPRTWDVAQGLREIDGKPIDGLTANSESPDAALRKIETLSTGKTVSRNAWMLRDLNPWLQGPAGASVLRQLRNLCRSLPGAEQNQAQSLIMLTPGGDLPPELQGHATVVDWPLPDRAEIAEIVDQLADRYQLQLNGQRDLAIDAAVGLTGEQAQAAYATSIVRLKRIDPVAVATEKKRVITSAGVMEWIEPLKGGLDAVGGLQNVKRWLLARAAAYTPEARAYGLPLPRGIFVVGVPGCGKSLLAKGVATYFSVPLLRLDLNALKSKFLGESETNLRKAFAVIAALGRCVVWIDEIEKALAGATQGAADGGVSADALGAFLSWMQERSGEAFVIATANDVTALPPELTRKGRFDETWFVDLPTSVERVGVVNAALREYGRSEVELSGNDMSAVVAATDGFSGAEIAELVRDGLFRAFADEAREIEAKDILMAAKTIVPMKVSSKEKIEALRAWATGRARSATSPEDATSVTERAVQKKLRVLDVE